MRKYMRDMTVTENISLHGSYCLLKLTSLQILPDMYPGQFVQVRIEKSSTTFLRRPISIHYVDRKNNELWLLIRKIGDATRAITQYRTGDQLNLLLPLGKGFTISQRPVTADKPKLLLIGGGVGVAPLLFWGAYLKDAGFDPFFLLGARTKEELLQLEHFRKWGTVHTTTEDGSHGEKGFVTQHSILKNMRFDHLYTCGPKPMMMAVAKYAFSASIPCEVSLENTMACGIGACLCCVEDTVGGNVCVCTEGPVFNINKLKWQN
ncbi:MAG: dihydroorotate dehydrogenase electron transfer subunit [Tannerellaceae bacterium]|jgi:dihydroorotate dehydrogenase electron transfer subunit|nr:dihydroorotate dehydrogenase electron transfer subunit [Tannerellaceae bacterium]